MTYISKHLEEGAQPRPPGHSWGLGRVGWVGGNQLFLLPTNRAESSRDSWKEVDGRMVLGRGEKLIRSARGGSRET